MSNGYSGTPLPRKLGIKEGQRVAAVNAPDGFHDVLGELPSGVRYKEGLEDHEPFDVIVAFERKLEGLHERLQHAAARMQPDGGLWVAWAKKSSPLAGELSFELVQRSGLSLGLVDNKVCAIDADWSGLRFVVRKEDRPRSG